MPWRSVRPMEEKIRFLGDYLNGGTGSDLGMRDSVPFRGLTPGPLMMRDYIWKKLSKHVKLYPASGHF